MNNYFKLVAIVALVINLAHLLSARSISFDDNMLEGMIESSLEKMLKNETKSDMNVQQNDQQEKQQEKYISYELNEDLKTLLKDELHLLERIQEQIKLKNMNESEVKQIIESLKVQQREARNAFFDSSVDGAVLYHIYDATTDNTLGLRKKRQAFGFGSDYSYSQPMNTFVQQPQFQQSFMDNSFAVQQQAPSFDQSFNFAQPQVQQTMDYSFGQPAVQQDFSQFQQPAFQQDFSQFQQPAFQQDFSQFQQPAVQQDFSQFQQPAQYQDTTYQQQPQFDQPITVQIETQQYIQPVYPSTDNTAATYVQSINTQSYNDDVDIRTLLKNQPVAVQQPSFAPVVQQSFQPAPVQQSIYGASASNFGPAPVQDAQISYEIVQQPQETFTVQQDLSSYGLQQDQSSYGIQEDQSDYGVQQDQSGYGLQQDLEQTQGYGSQEQAIEILQDEYQDQDSQSTYGQVQQPQLQQSSYAAVVPAPVQVKAPAKLVVLAPAPAPVKQATYVAPAPAPVPVQNFVVQAPVRQQATYVNTVLRDQTLLREEKIPSSVCPTGFAEPIFEGEEVGETYCRCLDGSYGFSCTEGFVNPCYGDSQFYPADSSLPRKYFIHCSWDIPYLKKCSGDLVWNNLLQTCDWNSEPAFVQQAQTVVSFSAPQTAYGY